MHTLISKFQKIIGLIFLIPVYIYKYLISPLTPASCRHTPTCSEYAVQAIKIHGPFKGFLLAAKRIAKCHPWGTHGYDPVPPKVSIKYKKMERK
jgi:putative membrane protein insertion efficiency factor